MSRSSKKGAFVDKHLMKKVQAAKADAKHKPIKTWSRRSSIFPEFVGVNFSVYNGKSFINVYVSEDMVGHKLGEFVPTRTFKAHSSNNKAEEAAKESAPAAPVAGVK
ncbi:MAG: 30S ribosomal protein S19 [Mycoplasmataceae bacterium]|jgi:small subunit ribosomal protein S19|nr:30S ribosomal protein S19 [Mycoplasmataceae bacterium]